MYTTYIIIYMWLYYIDDPIVLFLNRPSRSASVMYSSTVTESTGSGDLHHWIHHWIETPTMSGWVKIEGPVTSGDWEKPSRTSWNLLHPLVQQFQVSFKPQNHQPISSNGNLDDFFLHQPKSHLLAPHARTPTHPWWFHVILGSIFPALARASASHWPSPRCPKCTWQRASSPGKCWDDVQRLVVDLPYPYG